MNVTVLFFGATAASVGKRKVEISLEEGLKASDSFLVLLDLFPALKNSHDPNALLYAINQEYARGDEIIRNGDELAVFTAVSGG